MDYKAIAEALAKVLTILGDVTISEAKKWADVKANAEELEHETEGPNPEG